jgi:hypothetical protein
MSSFPSSRGTTPFQSLWTLPIKKISVPNIQVEWVDPRSTVSLPQVQVEWVNPHPFSDHPGEVKIPRAGSLWDGCGSLDMKHLWKYRSFVQMINLRTNIFFLLIDSVCTFLYYPSPILGIYFYQSLWKDLVKFKSSTYLQEETNAYSHRSICI